MTATSTLSNTALDFSRMMTVIAMTNNKTESHFSVLLSKMEKEVSRKAERTNSMMASRFLCPLMPLTWYSCSKLKLST